MRDFFITTLIFSVSNVLNSTLNIVLLKCNYSISLVTEMVVAVSEIFFFRLYRLV